MSAQVLHWSAHWADVVGGDGYAITDLLGRIGPGLTEEQAAQLRKVERGKPGGYRTRLQNAAARAWEFADRNGLRTAMACAAQSANRVIDTLAPFDPDSSTNDHWSRWEPARRALGHVLQALVIRRCAPADLVDELAEVWCEVMGPLRPYAEVDTEQPAWCPCQPRGEVRYVTEAEAARHANSLLSGREHWVKWAQEDAAKARRMLAEHTRHHISHDDVRAQVRRVLDSTPGINAKARARIEQEFGLQPSAPAQGDLFSGAAS